MHAEDEPRIPDSQSADEEHNEANQNHQRVLFLAVVNLQQLLALNVILELGVGGLHKPSVEEVHREESGTNRMTAWISKLSIASGSSDVWILPERSGLLMEDLEEVHPEHLNAEVDSEDD